MPLTMMVAELYLFLDSENKKPTIDAQYRIQKRPISRLRFQIREFLAHTALNLIGWNIVHDIHQLSQAGTNSVKLSQRRVLTTNKSHY